MRMMIDDVLFIVLLQKQTELSYIIYICHIIYIVGPLQASSLKIQYYIHIYIYNICVYCIYVCIKYIMLLLREVL